MTTGTALATSALWVPTEHLHSSWVGWPEFLTLNVCAVAAGSVARLRHVVLIGIGWGGLWTVAIPPFATNQTWQGLAGTALNFVMFAALLQVVATFMGRIAVVADEARRQAVVAAAESERHRARVLVHDSASMLTLLADLDTPEVIARHARNQACETVRRMRHYLTDDVMHQREGAARTLGDHPVGVGRF